MKTKHIDIFAILAAIVLLTGTITYATPPMTPNLEWEGRIVVEFSAALGTIHVTNETGIAQLGEVNLDALARRYQVYDIHRLIPSAEKPAYAALRDISRYYIVEFPPPLNLHEVARAYQSNPYVITAEPYKIHTCLYTPADPFFASQWALTHVNAEAAYDFSRGSRDVTIGIVDIGIDTTHEDLRDNLWINPGEDLNQNGVIDPLDWNGIDDDQNGYVDDFWGWNVWQNTNIVQEPPGFSHGTSCSGAASAVTDNGIGIASLGYQARLMIAKAGDGEFIYEAMQGVMYCVENGADIITMSFGGPYYNAYEQGVMTYAWENGVAIFAACGGDAGTTPFFPAAYDHVVGVGSTGPSDQLSPFTNYGDWVDVYAPGGDLLLTIHGSQYEILSGTSFSCPIVAGLAGLVWAADPTLTNDQVVQQILTTAVNIDSLNPGYEGLLRIDAGAALAGLFLQVDLEAENPPIIIPPEGGNFDYTVEVINQDSLSREVDFWSDIVLPNGSHYGPIMGPVAGTLSANASITRSRTQTVPSFAPSGEYLLIAYLGNHPSSICSRDTIPFTKQGVGGYNRLDGFTNRERGFTAPAESLPLSTDISVAITPNPFNPTTTITFDLPVASQVKLQVFDIHGRRITSHQSPATSHYSYPFDGSHLPSGIYFYRLTAGDFTGTGKMVLMK